MDDFHFGREVASLFDDAEIATLFRSIFEASRVLAARLFSASGPAS